MKIIQINFKDMTDKISSLFFINTENSMYAMFTIGVKKKKKKNKYTF